MKSALEKPSFLSNKEKEMIDLRNEAKGIEGALSEAEEIGQEKDNERIQALKDSLEKIKEELELLKEKAQDEIVEKDLIRSRIDGEGVEKKQEEVKEAREKIDAEGIREIEVLLQRMNKSPEAERARYAGMISVLDGNIDKILELIHVTYSELDDSGKLREKDINFFNKLETDWLEVKNENNPEKLLEYTKEIIKFQAKLEKYNTPMGRIKSAIASFIEKLRG